MGNGKIFSDKMGAAIDAANQELALREEYIRNRDKRIQELELESDELAAKCEEFEGQVRTIYEQKKELEPEGEVTIVLACPDLNTVQDIAHITAKGEEDTTTMSIIAGAAIEAYRHGADILYITGEGAQRIMEASSWGVMLGSSVAGISENDDTGGTAVIAPGVGYGKSRSAYEMGGWIQATAFMSR